MARNGLLEIAFEPGEADRRVVGVAAAARLVHRLTAHCPDRIVLAVPGARLAQATVEDMERVNPNAAVEIVERAPGAVPAPRLDAREILLATAKPSDGVVSRWLNRPVSRFLSAQLLRLAWIRPIHATLGTAILAAIMFAMLVAGGRQGLIASGLLFHAASVFDGVDGEIARATFRTSRTGALLDGVIDVATNFLFILGVTVNLAASDPLALPLGAWGLMLFILGLIAISHSAARADRPFSMELVKQRYRARFPSSSFGRLLRLLTIVTSRDFFALLFALLILAGLPIAVLYFFAAAATIWILFVIGALVVPAPGPSIEGSA